MKIRDNMVTRFEETVKQEIINHNKSIAQSNNLINKAKEDIKNLSSEIIACKNLHVSNFSFVADQFAELSEYVESKSQEHCSRINDIKPQIDSLNERIQNIFELFVDVQTYKASFDAHVSQMAQLFLAVGEHFQILESNFNHQIERLEKSYITLLQKTVDSINLPSQLQLMNQNLNSRIDEQKNVLQSLHEENAILKKEMFVLKKHLERQEILMKRIHEVKNES